MIRLQCLHANLDFIVLKFQIPSLSSSLSWELEKNCIQIITRVITHSKQNQTELSKELFLTILFCLDSRTSDFQDPLSFFTLNILCLYLSLPVFTHRTQVHDWCSKFDWLISKNILSGVFLVGWGSVCLFVCLSIARNNFKTCLKKAFYIFSLKLLHSFGKFPIDAIGAWIKPKIDPRTLHHLHQIKESVLGGKTWLNALRLNVQSWESATLTPEN